jgi:hypothetical protein
MPRRRRQAYRLWEGKDHFVLSGIYLQTFLGNSAPVGKVPAGEGRGCLVNRSFYLAGQAGVSAVGPHGHSGLLSYGSWGRAIVAVYARDAAAFRDEFADRECLPQFSARFDGSVYKHFVERRASWATTKRQAIYYQPFARQRDLTGVQRHFSYRRAIGGKNPVEQTPAPETPGAVPVYHMAVRNVAWEGSPIKE